MTKKEKTEFLFLAGITALLIGFNLARLIFNF